jgi:Fe/S biogenesis protein NfuA
MEDHRMLTFTEAARHRILDVLDDLGGGALRISLDPASSPLAPTFELQLVEPDDREPEDVVLDAAGLQVILPGDSRSRLEGAVVDYAEGTFDVALAAAAMPAMQGELAARVQAVLEQRVNPAVAGHGGRITLVGLQQNVAYVRMSGGCQGCGLASVTLRKGVERMLREAIPELAGVQDVTDHADGRNPFYAAHT